MRQTKQTLVCLGSAIAATAAQAQSGTIANALRSFYEVALIALVPVLIACTVVAGLWYARYLRRRQTHPGSAQWLVHKSAMVWAVVTLSLGLVLAMLLAYKASQTAQREAQLRFMQQVDRSENSLLQEVNGLVKLLSGVRGTFVASESVSREEFGEMVDALDLPRNYPGVRGIGFIERVKPPQLAAFLARQESVGGARVLLQPVPGAPAVDIDAHFPVKFMEPLYPNRAELGTDFASEPLRRQAMVSAMESGEPAMTPKTLLHRDKLQRPMFFVFLPVYRTGQLPSTVEERTSQLQGWAFMPVIWSELMAYTNPSDAALADVQIFDGADFAKAELLYDSHFPSGEIKAGSNTRGARPNMFTATRPVLLLDQVVYLRVSSGSEFEASVDHMGHLMLATGGAALSVLAALVVWLLAVGRSRAEKLASDMTADLNRLAMVAKRTSNAVVITDIDQRITWVNDGFTRITGFSFEEALGCVPGQLLQSDQTDKAVARAIGADVRARRSSRHVILNRHKNGHHYWLDLEIQPMLRPDGTVTGFMAMETDVTAQVEARNALALERERAENILEGTGVGTWESNLVTKESTWSERWGSMMGYTRAEVVPNADVFWRTVLHPDDQSRLETAARQCVSGEIDGYACEVRARRKDGSWMWILTRAKVMSRLPDGRVEWLGGIHTDITESKRAEFSLRDAEAFLDRAGRIAGVGAWQIDLKTGEIVWSDQTCAIYGVTAGYRPSMEEMLAFYLPDAREALQVAMSRAVDTGESWDLTTELVNTGGQTRWVRSFGEVEFDEGVPVRLVGAFQDVTKDIRAQKEVQRSGELLRGAIDAINEAFVVYDPQDRLVFCNEKYRALYAKSAAYMVEGATFESILRGGLANGQYPAAIGREEAWLAERLAAHRLGDTTLEQRLDDGRWLNVVERKMPDGHIVGFRVDITSLKEATAQAELAGQSLAETTALLQKVLDSAVDVGIISTGTDRVMRVFNKGAENLLGYRAQDVVGIKTSSMLFDLTELAALRESLELQFGRAPTVQEVFDHVADIREPQEWTFVRKNGERFKASLIISPMLDSAGVLAGHLAIVYDISKQKEYEASLRNAMHLAEQSSVAKSQFLANMSHEIRTPMNAILGMLQLLQNTALDGKQDDYVEKANGAARSLLGLLNDILDFSKVEAGKMQLAPEVFKLEALLGDLSVILASNLGDKNVDLVFEVDPAIPAELIGDALRLKQVLINLGGNAVKFTEQGHVVIRWEILARTPDRIKLQISVRDTGIGIALENQARIFEAFTQAESDTTRRFGGTGLGLVISTRLIQLMGGELSLTSTLGQGSNFSFSLEFPLLELGTAAAPLALPGTVPKRVMLVDDNPVALDSYVAMASSLGWEVAQAGSGEEALHILHEHLASDLPAWDAVFVDARMPGHSGWDTIRAMRRAYGDRAMPRFILLGFQGRHRTGSTGGGTAPESDLALVDATLVKPLTASMLAQSLAMTQNPLLPQPTRASGQDRQWLAGMRILLVEDNAINQQVASELLQAQGAHVTLADNGLIGVNAVKSAQPVFDAVLMDLQMPVMDGLTATRLLRQDPQFMTLPVIAMTANAMATDREACLLAGMNDHVGKPFDVMDLVKTLVRHTRWSLPAVAEPTPDPAQTQPASAADASLMPGELPFAWPGGLEIDGALTRMGGNRSLLRRSIGAFMQDAQGLYERVTGLLRREAPADARRELHTFKGVAATLGATRLAELAARAEKAVDDGSDRGQMDALLQQVARQVADVLPALQQVSDRLGGAAPAQDAAVSLAPGHAPDDGVTQPEAQTQLAELLLALQESDMVAMELHAALRQHADEALAGLLEPLDAAMADMEFERAAVECEKLIAQLTVP